MRRRLLRSVKIVLANILAVSVSFGLFSDVIALAHAINVTTWDDTHGTTGSEYSVGTAQANTNDADQDASVYISAEASDGYHFTEWSGNVNFDNSTQSETTFAMIDRQADIMAHFEADAPAPAPAPAPAADPEPEPENNEPEYVPDTDPLTPQNDNGQTEEPQVTEPDPFEGFQQDTIKTLDDIILNQAGFTSYAPGVHLGVQNYTNSQIKIDSGDCVSFKSDVYQKMDEVLAAGIPIQLNYVYDNQQCIIVLPPNLPFKLASICDSTGYCGFETLKLYLIKGGYIMPVYEVLGYKSTSETNATPTPTPTPEPTPTPTPSPKPRLGNTDNKVVDLSGINLGKGAAGVSANAIPVTMTANKAALQSSVPTSVAVYAKVSITFKKGAEGSTVTTKRNGASANVINNTRGDIQLIGKADTSIIGSVEKFTVKDTLYDQYAKGANAEVSTKEGSTVQGSTVQGNSVIYGYIPENSICQLWYVPTNPETWPTDAQTATN